MTRITPQAIKARKSATPIVVLTAYTAPIARLLDKHVDILLVGDSMGMVLYGMPNTQGVTLEMMNRHAKAVVGASASALVVVDMPYGSYATPQAALSNAQKLMDDTGASAVKLEGGEEMAETIRLLVSRDIPVMGHVGLLPQSVTEAKGFRYQGKTEEEAAKIIRDAKAVEAAGAFSIVIEAVREEAARKVTESVSVPAIGIGASPACDGQVLVIDDMLGMGGYVPSFVKKYTELAPIIEDAVKNYAAEVKARTFPSKDYYKSAEKKS